MSASRSPESASRQQVPTAAPSFGVSLVFLLSTKCNLECVYCNVDAGPKGVRAVLDPRSVEQWLGAFASLQPSEIAVQLHGGEPLIADPPVELFAAVVRNTLSRFRATKLVDVGIQSNGLNLDEKRAGSLQRSGVRIDVSIDGSAAIHDRQRPTAAGRGSHREALAAHRLLRARGNATGVIAVSTDPEDVVPALEFFVENAIPDVRLNPVRPEGRGASFRSWDDPSFMQHMADEFFRAARRIAAHNERCPDSRLIEDNMSRLLESLIRRDERRAELSWTFLIDDRGCLWAHPGGFGVDAMRLTGGEPPTEDLLRRALALRPESSSTAAIAGDLRQTRDRLLTSCAKCPAPDYCVSFFGPSATAEAAGPVCVWTKRLVGHLTRWLECEPSAAHRIVRRPDRFDG